MMKTLFATAVRSEVAARNWVAKKAPSVDELEEGSTTVEYAIGAIATAGFAGLLIAVLKSGGVRSLINGIIQSALSV